jgi:hypothetical protein
MSYKEAIEKAAVILHDAQRREAIEQIGREYQKSFRKVFQDVADCSHKKRGYLRE